MTQSERAAPGSSPDQPGTDLVLAMPNVQSNYKATKEQRLQQASVIWDMRMRGWNYERITEATGLTAGTISNRVTLYMETHIAPQAEDARTMLLARVERRIGILEARLDTHVYMKDTDRTADENLLAKYYTQLYDFNGLRSVVVDVSHTVVDPQDMELQQLLREAKAKSLTRESRNDTEL